MEQRHRPRTHDDSQISRDVGGFRPRGGRNLISVIGIDRYRAWRPLNNAVRDARGALAAFIRVGFEPFGEPLLDEAATFAGIRRLVTDGLSTLSSADSLVLFFAGHGHTETRSFDEGDSIKTGYIIPHDGDLPEVSSARWLRLDSWLSDIARLRAKHILVFLDACHSGIALSSMYKWRDNGERTESFHHLSIKRSRRVVTSAQDDQLAMDGGPIHGHSLFTGCLLEGLSGGLGPPGTLVTGSRIGSYLQDRVTRYPQSTQTPDFGALEEDRRGELIIQLSPAQTAERSPPDERVKERGTAIDGTAGTVEPHRSRTTGATPPQALPAPPGGHRITNGITIVWCGTAGIVLIIVVSAYYGLQAIKDAPSRPQSGFGAVLEKTNSWRGVTALNGDVEILSHQVTLGEYFAMLASAEAAGHSIPRPAGLPPNRQAPNPTSAKLPITSVSYDEAVHFCSEIGGKLLSVADWYLIGNAYGQLQNADGTFGPLREWTAKESDRAKACGIDGQRPPRDMGRYEATCTSENSPENVGFRCARYK